MNYKEKNNIHNLVEGSYTAEELVAAGMMKMFCNKNTDNILPCYKIAKTVKNMEIFQKYFNIHKFTTETDIRSCLKIMVGNDNNPLCYQIYRYLALKEIETYVYNDKTSGKFICLLLNDQAKKKLEMYFKNIGIFNEAKKKNNISNVHSFSEAFIKSAKIPYLTNLDLIDMLKKVATNTKTPITYFKINDDIEFESDVEIVNFFEKEIIKHSPLFCLVGPSGCGKTSVANCLETKGLIPVESYTTRAPRYEGEKGHTFISEKEFDEYEPEMISKTKFSGYRYGITEKLLNNSDLFVVDPIGIKELKKQYHNRPVVVIGLSCSRKTAETRMLSRGDDYEVIQQRLLHDDEAFFDYEELADVVISTEQDFANVLEEVLKTIKTYSL